MFYDVFAAPIGIAAWTNLCTIALETSLQSCLVPQIILKLEEREQL